MSTEKEENKLPSDRSKKGRVLKIRIGRVMTDLVGGGSNLAKGRQLWFTFGLVYMLVTSPADSCGGPGSMFGRHLQVILGKRNTSKSSLQNFLRSSVDLITNCKRRNFISSNYSFNLYARKCLMKISSLLVLVILIPLFQR